MKTDDEHQASRVEDIRSKLGEIYVPFAVAAVPSGLFMLLGCITKLFDESDVHVPLWGVVGMIAVQTLGTIAMAFVFLTRFELGMRNLMNCTDGHPHVLRKLALMLSFACLLIFDILTNMSTAFSGAGFLVAAAVPVFFVYLVLNRIAIAGLRLNSP